MLRAPLRLYLLPALTKLSLVFFFFFNDTATTEIYTLSLHDALPISAGADIQLHTHRHRAPLDRELFRSEEHTSELQSRQYLVCRLLLEKKTIISSRIWLLSRHTGLPRYEIRLSPPSKFSPGHARTSS